MRCQPRCDVTYVRSSGYCISTHIYIIILDPDERRPTTMRSNDTLVDTPFQLISGFFHVNQGVCVAEQASSRGVLDGGGGGGGGQQAC